MRADANKVKWYPATINDVECFVVDCRIDRNTIPKGIHMYETRHGDDGDWITPVELCHSVLVNWCNTVISKDEILSEDTNFIDLDESNYDVDDFESFPLSKCMKDFGFEYIHINI